MGLYKKALAWWRKRKLVVTCLDDRCPHYCKDCNVYCPPRTGLCKGKFPPPMLNPDVPMTAGSNAELAWMIEVQGKAQREFFAELEEVEAN